MKTDDVAGMDNQLFVSKYLLELLLNRHAGRDTR